MFTVSTYDDDIPLYEELGLTPIVDAPTHKEIDLGTIELEFGGTVHLFVIGLPAQFYRAEIHDPESGTTYKISTGSGTLSRYWPMFKALAENMLVIKEMRTEEK